MRTLGFVALLSLAGLVWLPAQSGSDVVDRRLAELSERIVESFNRLESARYRNKMAVLDFENVSDLAQREELGRTFALLLERHLLADPRGLSIVDRRELDRVLREQEIAVSDLADQGQVSRIGKIAAADLLIFGSVTQFGNDIQVTARMVETETAQVLLSETIAIPKDEFVAVTQGLIEMRHSVVLSYSLILLEDTPMSTAGIGYNYSFSRGLSLGFEVFYGTAHQNMPFTTTKLTDTFDWESEVNHLGFAVLLGFDGLSTDWVGLRLQGGPVISSYMDNTTLLRFTDGGTPYTPAADVATTEETAVLLGLMVSAAAELRITDNLDFFVGGQGQYFPPRGIKKDFYYLVPPASWNIVVLNQELTLTGLGLRAGLSYSF